MPQVPKMAVEFALTRCREFLLEHSNEHLDRAAPPTVFSHQWDQFLAWTYLLHRDDAALNAAAPEPSISVRGLAVTRGRARPQDL